MLARAVDVVLLRSCRVAKDEDVAAVRAFALDNHAPVLVAGPGAALSADRRVTRCADGLDHESVLGGVRRVAAMVVVKRAVVARVNRAMRRGRHESPVHSVVDGRPGVRWCPIFRRHSGAVDHDAGEPFPFGWVLPSVVGGGGHLRPSLGGMLAPLHGRCDLGSVFRSLGVPHGYILLNGGAQP